MSDPTMTNPNEPKISFNIKQPEIVSGTKIGTGS